MLNFIYWPISWVLRFWHEVIGFAVPKDTGISWILAIVLLTCTVRLLLLKPMVNQMRWRSSVARPSCPQLRFAAICSAADAMTAP